MQFSLEEHTMYLTVKQMEHHDVCKETANATHACLHGVSSYSSERRTDAKCVTAILIHINPTFLCIISLTWKTKLSIHMNEESKRAKKQTKKFNFSKYTALYLK